MGAQPSPDGDELRARAYLRALNARPFGHQEPPMPRQQPTTRAQIIPAAAPLPPGPPPPGAVPPWHAPPPQAPPQVVHHVHQVVAPPEPDPEPERPPLWARLWDQLFSWRLTVAILAALIPWAGGQSPVGLWSHTVHQARTEASPGAAYVIAGVAIATAWALDRRTGRAVPRFLLVTATLGAFGVLHWWDPILMLTGVTL